MRPAILDPLFRPILALRGVGEAVAVHWARLAGTAPRVPTLRDVLWHAPTGLTTRQHARTLHEAPLGQLMVVRVRVANLQAPPARRGGRKPPARVLCMDDAGAALQLVYFNAKPQQLQQQFPIDAIRWVGGVLERGEHGYQLVQPDVVLTAPPPPQILAEPAYPLTAGLTNRGVGRTIQQALTHLPTLPEWLDAALMHQRGWPSLTEALRQIHSPRTDVDCQPTHPARQRLAYDELLTSQLALGLMRARAQRVATPKLQPTGALQAQVLAQLPYQLTNGQQEVLAEIQADLTRGHRMQRLLQGDVGSGKTLVALMAMLMVVESGGQAALMAPTEILARQHLAGLRALCDPLGIRIVLLAGSLKGAERAQALQAIADGSAAIVLGTHALFQESVQFHNLQLAIIDEQHRFGVAQRLALTEKSRVPHLLLMTATPIPRSLTMTAFGDMECSLLREKPPGRQPITTRTIPASRREEVLQALPRAIAEGNKIYWICPLVEELEEPLPQGPTDLAAAETRYAEFRARFGERVALMHGRMKQPDRELAMGAFAADGADILVATTVVEVGVNVPEATIIVIEQAERFGLAQLHQLRGRVGRGTKASSCILLYSDRLSEFSKARLRVMRESEDGFHIAEEDLRLRGPGEILGTRQSGLPEFRFANLQTHADLVAIARDDVKLILHRDPQLNSPRGEALRTALYLYDQDSMARFVAGG